MSVYPRPACRPFLPATVLSGWLLLPPGPPALGFDGTQAGTAPGAAAGTAAGAAGGAAGGPAAVHRTLGGVEVEMPAVAGLDCEEIAAVMRRIDQSGYRRAAPLAPAHPDRALFDYEEALTRAAFEQCSGGAGGVAEPPSPAFLDAFRNE